MRPESNDSSLERRLLSHKEKRGTRRGEKMMKKV